MDLHKIQQLIFLYRKELCKNRINPDILILFGSYSQKKATKESDIDIAVVSSQFGKDRIKEGAKINFIASKIDARIEAIPISTRSYLDPLNISPLVHEIRKTGIAMF
ncbi:MAG TPA: nucleotidyltransferase domain-containing protein [Pseudobdellovibrionaceae bacterium]|nr:nucleotidyltransferase domain-containing protein [Pseudobdellovibrionaceae bacterium]